MRLLGSNALLGLSRVRGYPWLWLYSLCNTMAITVELISYGWVVLQLTNSPFFVGIAASAKGLSLTFLSVLAGPLLDRLDRRMLLLMAQLTAGTGAMVLALLVTNHVTRLWHVLCYLVLVGLVTGISRSSSGSLLYDIVGPQRLLNANALQSTAASLVRVAGAATGGIIIDRLGVDKNWLLVSTAYYGAAASLLLLKSPPPLATPRERFLLSVKAGVVYARQSRQIRTLLGLSVLVEAFGFGYQAMLPVMARDVLRVGGAGLGYLSAMAGVGQLMTTVCVASLRTVTNTGALLVVSAIGFGLFIVAFGLSPWFLVSLCTITIVGALSSAYDTAMATTMMTVADRAFRGRVLSLYYSTMGLSTVGWLVVGAVGTVFTVPIALVLSGGAVVLAASRLLPMLHILNAPANVSRA